MDGSGAVRTSAVPRKRRPVALAVSFLSVSDDIAQKSIAMDLLRGIAERDRPLVSSCLAEGVVWWVPQSAGELGLDRPLIGREATLGLLCGESRYEVGSMQWTYHHVLADDGTVAVHASLRARTKAQVSYENHYVMIYRFRGALIVEGWEHTDTAYAFARMAATPSGDPA
jgi:ketosteroid isomerase-like protein